MLSRERKPKLQRRKRLRIECIGGTPYPPAVTLAKMLNPDRWAGTSGARVADKWRSIQCHNMPEEGVAWYTQQRNLHTE